MRVARREWTVVEHASGERGAELVEWVVWVGSLVGVASAVGSAVRDGLGAAVGAVLAGLAGP